MGENDPTIRWDGLTIAVSVLVTARPRTVWDVLTDFDAYPEWSRAISRIEGAAVPGAALHAWLAQDTPFSRDMEGQIVEVDEPFLLVWEGGVPGELFGRHTFEIANQPVGAQVTGSETFSGALAPAVIEEHRAAIEAEFSQFLLEIKRRCEQLTQISQQVL
jgi:hypothetical protein